MLEAVIALSGEVHRNNFLDRQQVRKRYVAQQNDYTWHTPQKLKLDSNGSSTVLQLLLHNKQH
jgi:ABC-type transporter Mla MlaB component